MVGLLPGMVHVPENHVMLVEKYGKYVETKGAGACWLNPFTEKAHSFRDWGGEINKKNKFLELTQQFWASQAIPCITKEEIHIDVSAQVLFRIIDPYKAAYTADVLPRQMLNAVAESFRNNIAHHELEELSDIRELLSESVSEALRTRTDNWGIEIDHVAIGAYQYPTEIAQKLIDNKVAKKQRELLLTQAQTQEEQARKQAEIDEVRANGVAIQQAIAERAQAERAAIAAESRARTEQIQAESQAAIERITAESIAETTRIKAKAEAEAIIEKGRAEAAAYKLVADAECERLAQEKEAVGPEGAAMLIAEQRRAETIGRFLASPHNKVIMTDKQLNLKINRPSEFFGNRSA